ncbi:MAG: hypothetical protein WCH61_01955 [bacterium]
MNGDHWGFWPGEFLRGAGVGMIVVLLVLLVILMMRRQRQARGVLVAGENGDLYITANAIREFVGRVIEEFSQAALSGVALRQTGPGYTLKLALTVAPGTDLAPFVEQVRRRILQQAAAKAGMDKPLRVNVVIRGFTVAGDGTAKAAPTLQRNAMTGFPQISGSTDDL